MAPGVLTWVVVTSLVWGALLIPLPLAWFVIAFDFYWLVRSVSTVLYAGMGMLRVRRDAKIDWFAEYQKELRGGRVGIPWSHIHHVVVIPNFNEKIQKLHLTLEHLARQPLALRQITVVLAMEEREEGAFAKASALQKEFQAHFAHFFCTFHPANLPREVKGKSANEAWAARWAKRLLVDEMKYPLDHLTITSSDADSLFHPQYFRCLTYKFSTDPNRYHKFWQAPIFLHNNLWEVPMPLRVVSSLSSIHFLSELCKRRHSLFPQSTYSLSLRMADEVDYWDPDVIPEDWHMFLKCFFRLGAMVETEPIFLPIGSDAVQSTTYWRTLTSRYFQAQRHAWGAVDIPYAVREFLDRPEVPMLPALRRIWAVMENHLLWSTHWFMLTLGAGIPTLLAPALARLTPWGGLTQLSNWILMICLIPLACIILWDTLLRPPLPPHFPWWRLPFVYLQWLSLPLTSLFLATLPAVDAQTRLMVRKYIEYQVTEKV
ncbi:MAG: hypothetical protein HYU86_04640 [Chloroflexi bacterium]|nr:hypothetical protein [Chloroflexota bacterium]